MDVMLLPARVLHSVRNKSISAKFGVGVILLVGLMVVIAVTGYLALRSVRHADKSIWVSTEIQRLVLEMDRGMENARHLHGQFFLQYPRIGLKRAHERYAQPSVRQIAQVVLISKTLQRLIAEEKVSDGFRQSNIDLNLFLSSSKRFADTSIESVQLVSRLAAPEKGLEAQLDENIEILDAELSGAGELRNLLYDLQHFIHKHRTSRERFLMQSAFNVSFQLRNAIQSDSFRDSKKKDRVLLLLETIKKVSEQILEVDAAIKARFADFTLQKKAADAVSATLVELAREEVGKSQETIAATYTMAKSILALVSCLGLIASGCIAWFLNSAITRRVVRLTHAAEGLRRGKLDVVASEAPLDELGRLGQTFNLSGLIPRRLRRIS